MAREALLDPPTSRKLTLQEWFDLPEDVPGELVDGRLAEEEMADFVHEVIVTLLARLLGNWIFPRGGAVVGSEAKFAVSEERGRKPDLSVYFAGTVLPPRRGVIRVPPDLAIEVLSLRPRDTRRDRVDKLADYATFGVRWYWLIDPETRSLEILQLGPDGRYVHALGAASGLIDPVPGCEGLTLDLDGFWETVDRLAPAEE